MFKFCRKYKYLEKIYCLSLFDILKKIHISNDYSRLKNTEFLWRVSTKFKILFRFCFICYALFLMFIYSVFVVNLIIDASNNLFYIFVNLLILFLPLIILELILIFLIPIEVMKSEIER